LKKEGTAGCVVCREAKSGMKSYHYTYLILNIFLPNRPRQSGAYLPI
jgi:hypothetical protein